MQIVIDINDNEYLGIKNYHDNITSYPVTIHLYDAVRNGTPLPKGHDDLIDRNEAEKIADKMFKHITSSLLNYIQTYDVYSLLQATPTVIEADTENEVEK